LRWPCACWGAGDAVADLWLGGALAALVLVYLLAVLARPDRF
jgi:K+-transporting ATPase KdpF subunit